MKQIIILFTILLVMAFTMHNVSAATAYWVNDPADCPATNATEFPGQDCSPTNICGDPFACYDTSSMSAPSPTTSLASATSLFNGGFVLNCFADRDASAPYCDNSGNAWCDRNETVYTTEHRYTLCTDWGENGLGNCRSGYYNCYGDLTCESTSTSDCENSANNHYNTGTCSIDNSTAGSGTCVCDSGRYACDGSIVDTDGCEIASGASCGSNTGYTVLDQCYSSTAGNCTANGARANNRDCDDSDGDSDEITCNAGNGCEITLYSSTNNTNSEYQTCTTFECVSGYLDCDGVGDGTGEANGCEIQINGATGEANSHWGPTCDGSSGDYVCDTGFLDCNLDLGSSGDGCEVEDATTCYIGAVQGTYNGCTCEVDPQDIATTGTEVLWSGTLPMLWMHQYGTGDSIRVNTSTEKIFKVNGTSAYYDGTDLASGGGSGGNTTEEIQDAAWESILGGTQTRISVVYNDIANTVSFIVDDWFANDASLQTNISNLNTSLTTVTNNLLTSNTTIFTLANNINTSANIAGLGFITSADDSVSGSELDGVFSTTGILQRTASATYSTLSSTGTGNVVRSSSPTITTPTLTLSTSASTSSGRIYYDATNDQIKVGDGSVADVFMPVTSATDEYLCSYESTSTNIVCDIPQSTFANQNIFETISTTSGTSPVADSTTDTLTLTAGTGITVTGDSGTDSVTIASTVTDTNANTECSGTTTYLDGEGNCDDLSSTYFTQAQVFTEINKVNLTGGGIINGPLNITGDLNMTERNITTIDCIIGKNGGSWCFI